MKLHTESAAINIVSRVFAETQSLNLEQVTVAVHVPLDQALQRYTPPFRLHSVLTGLLVPVTDPHAHRCCTTMLNSRDSVGQVMISVQF